MPWEPSSSHRWLECQASELNRRGGEGTAKDPYALRGNAEHAHLQGLDKNGHGIQPPPIEADRMEGFDMAVAIWKEHINNPVADLAATEYEVDMEPVTGIHGQKGRIDLIAQYGHDLIIVDYKSNVGTFIPETHPELALQGMAAAVQLGISDMYTLRTVVVQPFYYDQGVDPVREHVWTRDELIGLWNRAATAIKYPSPEPVPGEHCRYCPGALRCTKALPTVLDALSADVLDDREVKSPGEYTSLPTVSDEVALRVVKNAKAIKELLRYAEGRVMKLASESSVGFGGFVVQKQMKVGTKIKDESTAKKVLEREGINPDELYETKVKPKTRLKKSIPKEVWGKIEGELYPLVTEERLTDAPEMPSVPTQIKPIGN